MEPFLAKQVAEGEVCPITLLPMEDINPTFVPRALKPIPMNAPAVSKSDAKGKGKARAQLPEKANTTSSILDFFGKSGGWIISVMSALVLIASLGSSYSTESESGRVHPSTTTTANPSTTAAEEEFLSAPSQSSWYHL